MKVLTEPHLKNINLSTFINAPYFYRHPYLLFPFFLMKAFQNIKKIYTFNDICHEIYIKIQNILPINLRCQLSNIIT